MSLILEICCFNIQSAIIAEDSGANRVELCDNPVEGGTTPGFGTIKQVRDKIDIDLYPIIRPRAGNYFYDDDEFQIIKHDIDMCKQTRCDGISVGVQLISGEIDVSRMKRIVEWAYPLEVTCNRVFDAVPDPFKALEQLIDCGCGRILTSGQQTAAPQGAELLRRLVEQANGRIIIMPGAGVRSENIEELVQHTGASEYHTSARRLAENTVVFQNPLVADNGNVYVADEVEIKNIIDRMSRLRRYKAV